MGIKPLFFLRNMAKMVIQNCILPVAYQLARLRYPGEKELYVFADAHHTTMPFSLQAMYDHVQSLGLKTACHFYDYTHEGSVKSLLHAIGFMKLRAQAKYIFICDTFVPVSSGRKDPGTKIVQLCHFSGPFKKIGYASADDIPSYYSGGVFKNYDLVTASSPKYVPILADAMRQPEGVVQALGTSRSDVYFDQGWVERCKENFYAQYPAAVGKKILLWTPTFRGKAVKPDSLNNQGILKLQAELGEDWMILIKHHPHDDAMAQDASCRSNCTIGTEELLPVVDLLITDYSTTVLDYLVYGRPFVLYAPDLEEYERTRGFFVDYRSITPNMTTDGTQLPQLVRQVYANWVNGDRSDIDRCRQEFVSACDGHATARILEYLHNM